MNEDKSETSLKSPQRASVGRLPIFIVKLIFTAIVFIWLFRTGRIDFSGLLNPFNTELWIWLLFGMIMTLGCLIIPAVRWHLVLKSQEGDIRFVQVLRWTWIGFFFKIFVPGGLGLDMTRGFYLMSNRKVKRLSSLSTVLMDRIIGLHSLLMVGFVSLTVYFLISDDSNRLAFYSWALLSVSMLLIFCLAVTMVSRRIGKILRKLVPVRFRQSYDGLVHLYRSNRRSFLLIYGISLVNALLNVFVFTFAGMALGYSVPIWIASVAVPLMTLSSLIPLTPGGLGIGEAVTAEFMTGMQYSGGGAISLLMRMMFYFWALFGGVLFLMGQRKGLPDKEAVGEKPS